MKKLDAIAIFRTVTNMAKSLEMTRQGIYNMPDELTQAQEDRVMGACHRLGIPPPHVIREGKGESYEEDTNNIQARSE